MVMAPAKPEPKPYTCTAEDLIRERDEKGLPWAQVAANLGLKGPKTAHKIYTELTGQAQSTFQRQGQRSGGGAPRTQRIRKPSRKNFQVAWDDDTDQDEMIERMNGAWVDETASKAGHWTGCTITVNRAGRAPEDVRVRRLIGFTFGKNGDQPLQVELHDSDGRYRAFRVVDIKEVR